MKEDAQIAVGLEEGLSAFFRMIYRGVTAPHIPATALVMVGTTLLLGAYDKRTVVEWLRGMADQIETS